jgi:predicted dehydrogenase
MTWDVDSVMLKVGVAGLGGMGRLRMKMCPFIDNVELVAAADSSPRLLREAESAGVKCLFRDYRDLLDKQTDLDAVIISLPNFLHADSIRLALEAGLHVFVEKPLANTAQECREIARLVEKSGRSLTVGHSLRFVEAVERMKEAQDQGRLGGLEVVTIEDVSNGPFTHGQVPTPVSEWWFDPVKVGGGALMDLGYHVIDLFRFFAGDCRVLYSKTSHKLNLLSDDSAIIVLESIRESVIGMLNVGWYELNRPLESDFRIILHGDSGHLSSDLLIPRNAYLYATAQALQNFAKRVAGMKIEPLSYDYYGRAWYKELKEFFRSVMTGSNPRVTVHDGLRTVELIQEAYDLARKGANNRAESS